ncbi:MAG: alkaline shock response membrane anchor protein AmaP [Candidatus Omnitrophica bacterium]|nr:alkaline shock response membrane anchor protein AmaP [Candidatus Omnitrophota bacterium]
MRPLPTIIIVFYTIAFIAIGFFFIAIWSGFLTLDQIQIYYEAYNLRPNIGIAGVIFILISIFITHITFGTIQRERTIAFNTPDGQVVISLSAIENFIKRLGNQMSDIKDMRPDVIATKKGVSISARISLWSDSNIPDVTERIQGIIKNKVQDMLGIEEPIITKVHITKIIPREGAKSPKKTVEEEDFSPEPPYRSF